MENCFTTSLLKTSAFYNAPRLLLRSVFFFFSDIKKNNSYKKNTPSIPKFWLCTIYLWKSGSFVSLHYIGKQDTFKKTLTSKQADQIWLPVSPENGFFECGAEGGGGGCSSLFFLSFLTAAKKKRRNREKVTVTTGMSSRGSRKGRRITSRSTAWRS